MLYFDILIIAYSISLAIRASESNANHQNWHKQGYAQKYYMLIGLLVGQLRNKNNEQK